LVEFSNFEKNAVGVPFVWVLLTSLQKIFIIGCTLKPLTPTSLSAYLDDQLIMFSLLFWIDSVLSEIYYEILPFKTNWEDPSC
jgi:hypothetical protein